MSFRMIAVMAILAGFPASMSLQYFAFSSALKRAATKAGTMSYDSPLAVPYPTVTRKKVTAAFDVYDTVYCARGQAENLIKQHKAQTASDRTSCRWRGMHAHRMISARCTSAQGSILLEFRLAITASRIIDP